MAEVYSERYEARRLKGMRAGHLYPIPIGGQMMAMCTGKDISQASLKDVELAVMIFSVVRFISLVGSFGV